MTQRRAVPHPFLALVVTGCSYFDEEAIWDDSGIHGHQSPLRILNVSWASLGLWVEDAGPFTSDSSYAPPSIECQLPTCQYADPWYL